jgi:hypothetical protein
MRYAQNETAPWKSVAPDWAKPESDSMSESPAPQEQRMGNRENQRVSRCCGRRNEVGDDKTGGGAEPDKGGSDRSLRRLRTTAIRRGTAAGIGRGHVLARVRYAGVNPVDWKIREAHLKQVRPASFPLTSGRISREKS